MLAVTDILKDPGPSQSQNFVSSTTKALFVDSNGQPLHIFVEASSILGRPRLIRNLRTYGAVISHSPAQAQIILVDPESEAGIIFVKDWGSESGKAVLDSDWVRTSIEKGSPLLWYDNWGGLRLRTDQLEGNSNETDTNHPLPTPRQTPVDSTPLDRRPTGRPVPSSQLPSQSHPTPSHVSAPSPSPSPADTKPSPLPPPPPQNDPPLVPQTPTNTVPCLPANLAATFMDVLKHQHQNGLVPNLPGWPGSITNQLLSQAFVPPVPQPTSFGTTFTNLFPSMTQSTPPQSFGHILPPPATPMTLPSHKNRRSPTPNSTILTPSLKRRSPHFDSSPALPSDLSRALLSSQSKGKERMSDGSPRPTKQVRLNKEPHFMYESPPPSSQLSTSSVHRDVFTDDEGKALCFVVQIDLRNRKDVVAAIKRCGGRICSEISQADFVILTPQSTSFHDLLHSCKVHDKPAVHAQFVHDCVERNALLDEDSYGFGEVEKGKRGKGRPKQSMSYSGSNKQAPASKKKASTISHRKHEEPSPTQQKSRPRPRAPAPATNDGFDLPIPQASPMKNGKNLFTPEESQYFSLYLVHLFEKDPLISNSAISKSLQSKMPQHSKGSWDAFLTKQKSEVEGIRKKAMIAYRRQQSAAPAGTGSQADEKSASNTEPPSSPESPPPPEVQGEGLSNEITLEELKSSREFRAITEFLGSGGADGRTDDEVWPILSDLHPFFSAQEWINYWETYGEHINDTVTEILASQPDQVPSQSVEEGEPSDM